MPVGHLVTGLELRQRRAMLPLLLGQIARVRVRLVHVDVGQLVLAQLRDHETEAADPRLPGHHPPPQRRRDRLTQQRIIAQYPAPVRRVLPLRRRHRAQRPRQFRVRPLRQLVVEPGRLELVNDHLAHALAACLGQRDLRSSRHARQFIPPLKRPPATGLWLGRHAAAAPRPTRATREHRRPR